jgi:hypothetical protein
MAPRTSGDIPTPHGDKLRELAVNGKLPEGDRARLSSVLLRSYRSWRDQVAGLNSLGDERVADLVQLLNRYKRSVELDFVWDSSDNFLYRQKGQLKLDGSILEEFLPQLADPRIIPELAGQPFIAGPHTAFSAAYFTGSLTLSGAPGLMLRTKDQDFTIGKPAYLAASFGPDFRTGETVTQMAYLAFVAAECKTNLDKTMFQEAVATAHDLKSAILGARYYLLCEWLDMTPVSTRATDIDQAIILRGKRLDSSARKHFASTSQRVARRDWYVSFLDANPIRTERVLLFVNHLRRLFSPETESEDAVLEKGYF